MKPAIPKGTRDFGPQEMLRRKWILGTIEEVFRRYGYLPLETPAMEHLETLTGKYGEEGDRLIFKVLKRGAELERALADPAKGLAGEALRYDLTVPFARYVVMNQQALALPFKRYQIQPVWRADRPQKGRYREFVQCDADVIGSASLLNEVELVHLLDEAFARLGLRVAIKLNNRKVLSGIAEVSGQPDKVVDIVTAIDKLDKIGRGQVEEEMRAKGVSDAAIAGIAPLFGLQGAWAEQRPQLEQWLAASEAAQEGLRELAFVFDAAGPLKSAALEFDPTLARGLDYYTGAIFEVKALEGTLGSSISGGGRYDDLTGVFGLKGMSGVGISFGADRIHDVLLETGKFPAELGGSTRVLFANFGEAEALHCLGLLRQVRDAGIAAELYPDAAKLPKQFTYAEKKGIPYVAIVGEEEMKAGTVTLKRMGANEKGSAMPIHEAIRLLAG